MSRKIEPEISAFLRERPGIKGVLKFYPDEIPQDESLPVCAYQTREYTETKNLRGRSGLKMNRILFVVWSSRRGQADELLGLIRDSLDAPSGKPRSEFLGTRGGYGVQACMTENEFSESERNEEGSDTTTYVAQCDVVVWYTGGD